PAPPLEFEEVELEDATDLEVVARAAGVSVDAVKELNPELRRWCTPPPRRKGESYRLKLPVGTRERFTENFAKVAPKDRLTFRAHRVGKGDTLSSIAHRFGTAPEAIMRMNGIKDSRKLRLGTELVIPVPRGGEASAAYLAEQSRRRGFAAAPKEQEIPAGTPTSGSKAAVGGTVRLVKEGARTKVVYAVANGDSPWAIAQRFGVGVEDIKKWNGFTKKRVVLRIGQELTLYPENLDEAKKLAGSAPAPGPAAAAKAVSAETSQAASRSNTKRVVHVLAPGDTLWSIAQRYGVSVDDIKRWNNLQKSDALKAGQPLTLLVPEKA
ncbi:MAG: LysM peptidoglycan-binding domain-containing protein, partial [Myxococcales bacterium]